MVSLLTHICVTRPQWVKNYRKVSPIYTYVKICSCRDLSLAAYLAWLYFPWVESYQTVDLLTWYVRNTRPRYKPSYGTYWVNQSHATPFLKKELQHSVACEYALVVKSRYPFCLMINWELCNKQLLIWGMCTYLRPAILYGVQSMIALHIK